MARKIKILKKYFSEDSLEKIDEYIFDSIEKGFLRKKVGNRHYFEIYYSAKRNSFEEIIKKINEISNNEFKIGLLKDDTRLTKKEFESYLADRNDYEHRSPEYKRNKIMKIKLLKIKQLGVLL